MNTELVKAEEFGVKPKQATELTEGLIIVRAERDLLIKEFKDVSKLEISEENLATFKELRLRIVRNRTQGIDKWHKANKDFFLTGGRFVDATKKKESFINEQMEEKLMSAEKHFENLERERVEKLQQSRVKALQPFLVDASERDLSGMEEDVWDSYLATKKKAHEDAVQAKIEADAAIEAKHKAEKAENERIRKENVRLLEEAKERARVAEMEAAKRQAERDERIAKEEAERKLIEAQLKKEEEEREVVVKHEREVREALEAKIKAKEDEEAKAKEDAAKQAEEELSKDDSSKILDLVYDLQLLKTKYTFKSAKNKKIMADVGGLLDKVTNFIQK